jgi:hypothetical protein
MRKSVIASALAGIGLAGCNTTSTADLRQQRPIEATFESRRPPEQIAQCLAENLGELGAPSIYAAGRDTVVSFHKSGNTMALFSIAPDGTTSVRRVNALIWYRAKVAGCF